MKKNPIKELDEGLTTEDRDFITDGFEPADESKNPRPDAAEHEIASESEERL